MCTYTPVSVLEDPIDANTPGAEEEHIQQLNAMQRLCGTEKIRQLLMSRARRILEASAAQVQLLSSEKDAIAKARLQVNPNKYSKAPQHQKSDRVWVREMGRCGEPNWPCTYAGEGLSPEEFKELEGEKLSQLNKRQSEEVAVQAQIKKYLAKLN